MSIDEFKHIIGEIKGYTDYVYLHIMGEPLLHPSLDEFISICKDNEINVNITTNGSLLSKRKEILINNNVRQLNVSLHSIEKEDDKFYEYVDEVLSVIKEINDNTDTYISLRLWNVEEKKNSRQKYILDKLSSFFDNDISNIDLRDYRNYKVASRVFLSMDSRFIWPSMSNDIYSLKGRCLGMKNMCGILVDGSVVPCCLDAQGDVNLGNIFTSSFKEIIEGDRCKNMLDGWNKMECREELCQRCSYRNRFDK
jgi:radical SAM protein with 4Fe4S-binding SPASM domain